MKTKKYFVFFVQLVIVCFISTSFFFCSNTEKQQNQTGNIGELEFLTNVKPRILVLYDSEDYYGKQCFYETKIALKYAKISFDTLDLSAIATLPDFSNYSAIATATETFWKLDSTECKKFESFVHEGGGMAILYRGWNVYLNKLFGIVNTSEPEAFEQPQHMTFHKEFMQGIKGLSEYEDDLSSYLFELDKNSTVLVASSHLPLVWLHKHGQGRVIFWNTSFLSEKINRGLIIQSIATVQKYQVRSIANYAIFFIDDFPNSSINVKIEPIKSEFGLTVSEFYTLRWFPDMIKLSEKYNFKYSSYLVFNYNGKTTPPYQFFEWLDGKITICGKELKSSIFATQQARRECEIGLHGYNHQSLTLKNWGSLDNMKLGLQEGKKRWVIDNVGEMPFSYVPPHNIYDSSGVMAVNQVFPSIKVFSGIYFGMFEDGGNREFGPEPWNKNIYCIPRNTSGHVLNSFNKKTMISLIYLLGIWSHFVHPDDVYPMGERYDEEDIESMNIDMSWYGGANKNGLYYMMENWLKFVKKHYPWLRFLTTEQAYYEMQKFDLTQLADSLDHQQIFLETNVVPSYFVLNLRENIPIQHTIGCEIIHSWKNDFTHEYVLKATEKNMILKLSAPIVLTQK